MPQYDIVLQREEYVHRDHKIQSNIASIRKSSHENCSVIEDCLVQYFENLQSKLHAPSLARKHESETTDV
jgi:hypothetical protein